MNEFLARLSALDLGPQALGGLSATELRQFDMALGELARQIADVRARLDHAIDARYGQTARAVLHGSGRDFGVAHIEDGPLHVTANFPKRVEWSQPQLAAIAQRIADSGERVEDYIDICYSISETRFKSWPPALRVQFSAARCVKPAKPTYRLVLHDPAPDSS